MKYTLYKNADWIITMDDSRNRYRYADLLVCDREIKDIGQNLREKYPDIQIDEEIDATGRLLIPGFVNTHHHTWQSLIRNIKATQGLALEPWLTVMYEIYKDLSKEVAKAGVYASLGEGLKSGCTTSNDLWYPHPVGVEGLMDGEIVAAAELGIRFHPVRSYHSQVSDVVCPEVVDTTERVMEDAARLVEKYHDRSRFSMCRVGIGPSIAQYDTEEILRATVDFAEKNDISLNKRISELSSQNQTLAFLKQQGLVDPDIFISKSNELARQLRQAQLDREKLVNAEGDMTAQSTRELIELLENGPEFLDSFDAELFGELVEKVIVESNDSIRFYLKNGLELRESIERTVR